MSQTPGWMRQKRGVLLYPLLCNNEIRGSPLTGSLHSADSSVLHPNQIRVSPLGKMQIEVLRTRWLPPDSKFTRRTISLPQERQTPEVDKTSICHGHALNYHCVEDRSEIFLPFGRFCLEVNTWACALKCYDSLPAQSATRLLRAWSLLGDRWPSSG